MRKTRNILIVEDEMVISMELAGTLKRLGYHVAGQVLTGEDAIEKAGELRPDLILMDIRLQGGIDGIEAAGKISGLYDIPVVFLTAHSDDITLHRAIAVQPSGYLIKPFHDRELYSTVELSLYKHDLRQRIRPSSGIIQTGFARIPDTVPCLFVSRDFMILASTKATAEMLGTTISSLVSTRLDSWLVIPEKEEISYPETVMVKSSDNRYIPVVIRVGFIPDPKSGNLGYLLFLSRRDTSA
ncbi:MAG: response regulator [Methanomicrobiales archaeon]|nr:response regulator [Methanomicrobiales archaeon]